VWLLNEMQNMTPTSPAITGQAVQPMRPSERIPYILNHSRTIAVVGLSPKPHRASFDVSRYMQAAGYRIIPINPVVAAAGEQVLGEKAYPTLQDAAEHEKIDLVNCFRSSEDIPPIVDAAIAIGARAVWMQLGISNPTAAAKAEAAGLLVVQDHCLKIDHRVLLSRGLLNDTA
jgi:predicted CoA-binding protein